MGSLQKNIFEHISLMAQEQIQIEFREELQQLAQLQANPMLAQQDPNVQQQILLTLTMESRKAKLIAEMTEEFKKKRINYMGQFEMIHYCELKAREVRFKSRRKMNVKKKADKNKFR